MLECLLVSRAYERWYAAFLYGLARFPVSTRHVELQVGLSGVFVLIPGNARKLAIKQAVLIFGMGEKVTAKLESVHQWEPRACSGDARIN